MNIRRRLLIPALAVGAASLLATEPAFAQTVPTQWRFLTFGVFAAIIALTMYVTYVAASLMS